MESNSKLWPLLALVIGIAVGANWTKIQKWGKPKAKLVKEKTEEVGEKIKEIPKKVFPKKARAKAVK